MTGPYYGALFSQGESRSELDRFHEGLKVYETELKDRGGTYFGGRSTYTSE